MALRSALAPGFQLKVGKERWSIGSSVKEGTSPRDSDDAVPGSLGKRGEPSRGSAGGSKGLVRCQVELLEHAQHNGGKGLVKSQVELIEQQLCRGAVGLHTPEFKRERLARGRRAQEGVVAGQIDRRRACFESPAQRSLVGVGYPQPTSCPPPVSLGQLGDLEGDIQQLEATAQALLVTVRDSFEDDDSSASTTSDASFEFDSGCATATGDGSCTPAVSEERRCPAAHNRSPSSLASRRSTQPSSFQSDESLRSWEHEQEDQRALMEAVSGLVAATNALSATMSEPLPSRTMNNTEDSSDLPHPIQKNLGSLFGQAEAGQPLVTQCEPCCVTSSDAETSEDRRWRASNRWAEAASCMRAEVEAMSRQQHPELLDLWRCDTGRGGGAVGTTRRRAASSCVAEARGAGLVRGAEEVVSGAGAVLCRLEEACSLLQLVARS